MAAESPTRLSARLWDWREVIRFLADWLVRLHRRHSGALISEPGIYDWARRQRSATHHGWIPGSAPRPRDDGGDNTEGINRMQHESEAVMRTIGALDLTVARESALQHEIERAEAAVPLIQRVAAICAAALAKADWPPASPLSEDERDALWTR